MRTATNGIQVAEKQEELEGLANQYRELRLLYHRLQVMLANLPNKPPVLTTVISLEQLREYKERLEYYDGLKQGLEGERDWILQEWRTVAKGIIRSLPISKVWVKVGDYAVGKYWDVWGGGHFLVSIEKWVDNLPTLHDTTYYP